MMPPANHDIEIPVLAIYGDVEYPGTQQIYAVFSTEADGMIQVNALAVVQEITKAVIVHLDSINY